MPSVHIVSCIEVASAVSKLNVGLTCAGAISLDILLVLYAEQSVESLHGEVISKYRYSEFLE